MNVIMNILFVCSGNTCRSPMAQALAAKLHPDWKVSSAGVTVLHEQPMTKEARDAVRQYGAKLAGHRSRLLDKSLMDWADTVYALSGWHEERLKTLFPEHTHKVRLLGEIPDPYGGGKEVYEACARQIFEAVGVL